jgi:ribose transport system substrate-binding protein
MRGGTRVVAVAVAAAAAVAAATAGGAGAGASATGVGLKLGRVVNTAPVGSVTGPWLVWNADRCRYETAARHPKTYRAVVRKVTGGPTTIGYMHYGDTDPFGVANSKSMKAMADLAGLRLNVYNLRYPSESEPLTQARTSVLKKDAGVIQAQQLDTLSTRFLKILQDDGCIPTVQMYLKVKNVPSFGAVWEDTGVIQGNWLAAEARKRGWKASETALVSCTDPDVGASVNVMFDTAEKALAARFPVPKANRYRLVCKYSQTQSAQVALRAWLTAHPDARHVLVNTIDDERMQGAINALRQSGRFDDALTIANGCDELGRKQVRSGLEGGCVAFFPERYGEWLVPLLQDVLAGNPVPSFTGSGLVVVTKANIGRYYKQ